MIDHRGELYDFRDKLNEVGCGFCLAKWTQVTIHLQNGETHSCHHPVPHKIPLLELRRNPSALHNTKHKKRQRRAMLNGERPAECDYCWRVEDSGPEFSDRTYKSFEPWSKPYFDKIRALRYQEGGAAQADNLALGLGAEPPETGFFDMSKDFADEMATRARVEDRDEYGDIGYGAIINFSADDNIDFRRLHGDAYDYDVSSDLFRLSDDLHGVDIKRVIMKLKQYMQSDEYSTLDSDLKDQVKNTIASLQSEYDEKMAEIFGEQ